MNSPEVMRAAVSETTTGHDNRFMNNEAQFKINVHLQFCNASFYAAKVFVSVTGISRSPTMSDE